MSTTTTAKPGIRKVSLGGIAKKSADKPAGKVYPRIPDDEVGTISKLAGDLRREKELFDSLEGSIKAKSAELKSLTGPFYFSTHAGVQGDIPSSVRCAIRRRHDLPLNPAEHDAYEATMQALEEAGDPTPNQEVGAVLITYQNRYPAAADEPAIVGAIGEANTALYFRQKFLFKIDGDQIPIDKAETVVLELQALFEKHGCSGALTAEDKVVAIETFHASRHTAFTPAQNAALEQVYPTVTMLKTKNVR